MFIVHLLEEKALLFGFLLAPYQSRMIDYLWLWTGRVAMETTLQSGSSTKEQLHGSQLILAQADPIDRFDSELSCSYRIGSAASLFFGSRDSQTNAIFSYGYNIEDVMFN